MTASPYNRTLGRWLANAADTLDRGFQAAVIIVCEGARGDLAGRLAPITETDTERRRAWINWESLDDIIGLSGGERRLLALARSLATQHPVEVGDAISGLDDRNAQLVTEAVAHAVGLEIAITHSAGAEIEATIGNILADPEIDTGSAEGQP